MACDPSAYSGFAVGRLTLEELARQGIWVSACRWRYGPEMRRDPFVPHRELAGRTITTDRIGFGFDGFGWQPGDHKGCLCSIIPVLRDRQGRFARPPEAVV